MNTWALAGLALGIAVAMFLGGIAIGRGGAALAELISDQRARKRDQLAEDEGRSQ